MTNHDNFLHGAYKEINEEVEKKDFDIYFTELDIEIDQEKIDEVIETTIKYELETTDEYKEIVGDQFQSSGSYTLRNEPDLAPTEETVEEWLQDSFSEWGEVSLKLARTVRQS